VQNRITVLFVSIFSFAVALPACEDHYVDWVDIGSTRTADSLAQIPLTVGKCRAIELGSYTVTHGGDVGDTYGDAVRNAHVDDASIATVAPTSQTWVADKSTMPGVSIPEGNQGTVFLACGVATGTTTLHVGETGNDLGTLAVVVTP
jgi:hypothetical protein